MKQNIQSGRASTRPQTSSSTVSHLSRRHLAHWVSLACMAGFSAGAVQAQEARVQTADEIVVSASRIDRQGFTAPTPTTVVGSEVLQQRATSNFADLLNELPAFRASNSTSGGVPTGLTGGTGANLADLRGLGAVRTLVLVDRRRFVASTNTGRVDLNLIPTSLIQQMDVVTGGASAAYGSDAVSGVVNLILKKSIDGVTGTVQYGQSSHQDAKTSFVSLGAGTSFDGNRGQVIAGLEYNDSRGVVDQYTRDWGRQEIYFVNPGPARPAGVPATVITENIHFGNITPGGLVLTTPTVPPALRALEFIPGGTRSFAYGQYQANTALNMIGGSNAGKGLFTQVPLDVPVRRYSTLARVTYDINEHLVAYTELSYANSRGLTTGLPRRDGFGSNAFLTILPTNPFLQQALTPAQLAQVPVTGLQIGRMSEDLGYPNITNENRTQRILAGLSGTLAGAWKWDINAQTGANNLTRTGTGQIVTSRFLSAINAITLSGQIVCADPVARAAGCQPLNILGDGAVNTTPAGKAYVTQSGWYKQKTTLDNYAANIQGEPFSSWAGPVSIAGGYEYRREKLTSSADDTSRLPPTVGFQSNTYAPAQGSYTAQELYLETIIPLAKDLPLAKSLNFNGAFRETDYSTSGKVDSWKAGLTYEPTPDLLLRATRSKDIRAPNIFELYSPAGSSTVVANVPGTGVVINSIGGNAALKPEDAQTTTIGIVFKPAALKRLRASVDFFKIDIRDQILTLPASYLIANNCAGLSTCVLTRNPTTQLVGRIDSTYSNISQFNARGMDLEAAYSQPLGEISSVLSGSVDLSMLGSRFTKFVSSLDGIDRVGQTLNSNGVAGVAKWVWNLTATYKLAAVTTSLNVRNISRGKYDTGMIGPDDPNYSATLPNSINNNIVPSVTYFNLSASYDLVKSPERNIQLYFTVNNVADRAPPLPFFGAYYDLIGRAFKGGVRFKF